MNEKEANSLAKILHEEGLLPESKTKFLHEMANLFPRKTGLSVLIWVGEPPPQHGHRVKVSNTAKWDANDHFALTISDNPQVIDHETLKPKIPAKEVNRVKRFVQLNKSNLLRLANADDYDTEDFYRDMIPVP